MNVSRTQIAKGFLKLVDEKGYESAVQSLAAYTATQKLDVELLLNDIARELESRGHLTLELQSARELTSKSRKHVVDYLQTVTGANSVSITEIVNPELIGGVKAITSEYELDWTVRGRLDRLMKQGGTHG